MSSPDLDALIVEHLADLDQVGARINAIEAEVFAAMGERAKGWAERNGWRDIFEYSVEGGWDQWNPWIAAPDWRTADTTVDDDQFDIWFQLSVGNGDTESRASGEDWFYLTRLCQAGSGQVGFHLIHASIVKPRKWKQVLPEIREMISDPAFTIITIQNEASIYLPFKIPQHALAAALRDEDPDAALDPFEEALDTLLRAKPQFDRVLQYLRSLAE